MILVIGTGMAHILATKVANLPGLCVTISIMFEKDLDGMKIILCGPLVENQLHLSHCYPSLYS